MRHVLERKEIRTEEVEAAHGRSYSYTVEEVHCKTCGKIVGEEKNYGYKREVIEKLETEHNLDELFAALDRVEFLLTKGVY